MACPDGKLAYATRGSAAEAVHVLRRGRGSKRGRKRHNKVYRCSHESCRAWHLADAKLERFKREPRPRRDRGWMREVEW